MFETKTGCIKDPLLEFDSALHTSTDPIFGLESWEPHRLPDLECIRVSAVCQPHLKDSLNQFWANLKNGFNGNRFVPYKGFRQIFTIPITDIENTINPDTRKGELDTRFATSVKDIGTEADIVFAVLPYNTPTAAREVYNELKAASFHDKIKTQCIRKNILQRVHSMDHAIDLWNISVGIFTKVGGTPWVLNNKMSEVGCFVGLVADSINANGLPSNKAGICEVVDNYGHHNIWAKEELPSLHFTRENGRRVKKIAKGEVTKLIESCLDKYCRELLGDNYQNRLGLLSDKIIVFHLTDDFSASVLDAMEKAVKNFGLQRYQLVYLKQNTPYRLYSDESADKIPKRGLIWEINEENAILYTHGRREYHRGSVHRVYSRNKYRAITPLGVEILRQNKGLPIYDVCEQIVNLTGLCWYTTDIEMKMPVTIKFARKLSNLWKRGVLTDFEDIRYIL